MKKSALLMFAILFAVTLSAVPGFAGPGKVVFSASPFPTADTTAVFQAADLTALHARLNFPSKIGELKGDHVKIVLANVGGPVMNAQREFDIKDLDADVKKPAITT